MIGTKLADRYEVTRELGRGGMGVVYGARDPLLEREVAIKVVGSSLLDAGVEERFQREARIVARMDHPAIVSIHDLGKHDGRLFIVMPLVAGRTLRERVESNGLRLDEILDVAVQTAQALDYAHARGVIHRDVKPENILVERLARIIHECAGSAESPARSRRRFARN